MIRLRNYHKLTLNRSGNYFRVTRYKVLILNPSSSIFGVELFPDAEFVGICGHENTTDPLCVKIRTGFVITIANLPVLWQINISDIDLPIYYGF